MAFSFGKPSRLQNLYVNICHIILDSVAGVPSTGDVFQDTELLEGNVTRIKFDMIVMNIPASFHMFCLSLSTNSINIVVKLGSRSKVYLKSLGDLDLELDSIIAMSPPPPPPPRKLF